MKNTGNIGNRGNEKSDHKYTCDILNKMTYRGKIPIRDKRNPFRIHHPFRVIGGY